MNTPLKTLDMINPQGAANTPVVNANPFTAELPALHRVTDKYRFVSTAEFIRDMFSLGYKLESTRQPRSGLGMHSMEFSHPSLPTADGLGLRILATNSHDATSAFRLYIQVLVQVCSNGLVAWRSDGATDARVVHRGYALDKVQAALAAVNNRVDGVISQVTAMQNINVTPELAAEYLLKAAALRDAQPHRKLDLQRVVFPAQAENNAWNVFNRVQYSLIKGTYATNEVVTRPNGTVFDVPGRKARELTAVRERVQVNTKLWELSVETFLNTKARAA
jgi:Domain of unknown function (DUF932)